MLEKETTQAFPQGWGKVWLPMRIDDMKKANW